MLAAAIDAFFQDPVLRTGVPGVEYFAHAQELNPRIAKEFLFLGERMPAERAYAMGMVNRAVPRDRLEAETYAIAARIATQPRLALALAKQVLNRAEDLQGLRATIPSQLTVRVREVVVAERRVGFSVTLAMPSAAAYSTGSSVS